MVLATAKVEIRPVLECLLNQGCREARAARIQGCERFPRSHERTASGRLRLERRGGKHRRTRSPGDLSAGRVCREGPPKSAELLRAPTASTASATPTNPSGTVGCRPGDRLGRPRARKRFRGQKAPPTIRHKGKSRAAPMLGSLRSSPATEGAVVHGRAERRSGQRPLRSVRARRHGGRPRCNGRRHQVVRGRGVAIRRPLSRRGGRGPERLWPDHPGHPELRGSPEEFIASGDTVAVIVRTGSGKKGKSWNCRSCTSRTCTTACSTRIASLRKHRKVSFEVLAAA